MIEMKNALQATSNERALPDVALLRLMFFLSGISMMFNGYLGSVRFSDIVTAAFVMVAGMYALRSRAILFTFIFTVIILVSILQLSKIGFSGMGGDDRVWIFRCNLAFFFGSIFSFANGRQTIIFVKGIFWGGFFGFLVALLEYWGLGQNLISFGLRTSTAAIRGLGELDQLGSTVRVSGMWGDANEFGPIHSITIVAALFLSGKIDNSKWMMFFSTTSVFINMSVLSFNRSSVIASFLSVFRYYILLSPRKFFNLSFRITLAVIIMLALFYAAFPDQFDLLFSRFDMSAADSNAGGRLASFLGALTVLNRFPGGLSSSVWPDYLRSISWVGNPHNAFLSIGFGGGALLSVYSMLSFIYLSTKQNTFIGILSFHLLVLFFFETLNFSPGIIYFLGIVWARPIFDLITTLKYNSPHNRQAMSRDDELLLKGRQK